jgi:hypothetical protein
MLNPFSMYNTFINIYIYGNMLVKLLQTQKYYDPEMSSNLYVFYKSKMDFWNILNGCGWMDFNFVCGISLRFQTMYSLDIMTWIWLLF